MNVVVTGAAGFMGAAVVRALLQAGHDVHAWVRRPPPPGRLAHVRWSVVDLETDVALEPHLEGAEAVVHLAGLVSRRRADSTRMFRLHLECTRRILAAAKATGVRRWVQASTSGTIAVSASKRVMDEDHVPDFELIGRWPYYLSKMQQEQEVLRWRDALDPVILNPSLLLGPGDEKVTSTADVLDVLNGRFPAAVDGTVAFVDVRDCAPAFVAALERGRPGRRYLLNGANMSVRRFAERIALTGGVAPPRFVVPGDWAVAGAKLLRGLRHAAGADAEAGLDPVSLDMARHHWACDSQRAERELGFTRTPPSKTIADTVAELERMHLFKRTAAH